MLPEGRIGRKHNIIRRICDQLNVLHIFDQNRVVLKSGSSSTMGPPGR